MESSGRFEREDGIIDASLLWGSVNQADLVKVGQPGKDKEETRAEEPSTVVEETVAQDELFGGYEEPELTELKVKQTETVAEAEVEPIEQTEQADELPEQTKQVEETPAEQTEKLVEQAEQDEPTEPIEAEPESQEVAPEVTKASTRKPGLFSRLFKKPEQKVTVPKRPGQKLSLYILVEKYQPNFSEYLENRGIAAKSIRTDIEDIKIDLMTDGGMARVIVVEQGTGKFTATNMRKEIQDLAGMCDGSNKRLTMFYMRDILKLDLSKRYLGKVAAGIQWEVYDSIEALVKYLTNTGEVYACTRDRVDDTKTARMGYNEMLQLLPSGALGASDKSDDSAKKLRLGIPKEFDVSEKTIETYESAESLTEEEYDLSEDWVPGFVMKGL